MTNKIRQASKKLQKYFTEYYKRAANRLKSEAPELVQEFLKGIKEEDDDISVRMGKYIISKKGIRAKKEKTYTVKFGPSFVKGTLWIEDLSNIYKFDEKEVLTKLKKLEKLYRKKYKKLDKKIEMLRDLMITNKVLRAL